MSIDATFWVAIAFFIFFGGLFYLKVPQKVNTSLNEKINIIKKELKDSEKLKNEAKSLLSDYENKLDKSKKESRLIIETAKKESEKNILERTKKFHQLIEDKKINTLTKITQMKENALREIKNISINISIQSVENIIKNSIDKSKLDKLYASSLEEIKKSLKETKA